MTSANFADNAIPFCAAVFLQEFIGQFLCCVKHPDRGSDVAVHCACCTGQGGASCACKEEQFVELGKKVGYQELQNIFAAMSPQTKLSTVIGHQGGAPTGGEKTYKKLSEVSSDEILKLRKEQPEEYKRLYKAEYGIECEL